MGAHGGDRDAGLGQRGGRGEVGAPAWPKRTSESRPAAVRRATRLRSGRSAMVLCPRTQSGPWNSAASALRALRLGGRSPHVEGTTQDIGLPPAAAVGDEAQTAVVLPCRLAHRLGRSAGDGDGRPGRQRRLLAARAIALGADQGHHDERRRVPRHVGVVPDHHGEAPARPFDPWRTVEVAPLEEGRLGRAPPASAAPPHRAPAGALPPGGSHARRAPTRRRPWRPGRRGGARSPERLGCQWARQRRTRPAGGRAVGEPHALVGLIDVGEGAVGVPRHEADGPAPVFVDPAADAHPRRRVVGRRATPACSAPSPRAPPRPVWTRARRGRARQSTVRSTTPWPAPRRTQQAGMPNAHRTKWRPSGERSVARTAAGGPNGPLQ